MERKLSTETEWQEIASRSLGETSFTDLTLTSGFIYEYRVRAVNDSTISGFSNVVQVDLSTVIDERVDPRTVKINFSDALISADDKVYLLAKEHQSIFVWDAVLQDWDKTIPLQGSPLNFTYSAENNALYTQYSDGFIKSIGLAATNPVEVDFADFSDYNSSQGIIGAGAYILVSVANSNWDDHYTLDAAGDVVNMVGTRYEIARGVWSAANRNAYHFRDGTSPNDLIRTPVSEAGIIGDDKDSPYHSSTGIVYPIRPDPRGSIVLLGSGNIYDALSLTLINSLSFTIQDAVWLEGELVTMSGGLIYSHNPANYEASLRISPAYTPSRLLSRSDGSLIVISKKQDGNTVFEVFGNNGFGQFVPDILPTPGPVEARIAGASQVDLEWYDVSGESGYRIERRLAETETWEPVGTTGAGITNLTDPTVTVSNSYQYRVFATHTGKESAAAESNIVELVAPSNPGKFTSTVQSAFEIHLGWDATPLTTSYTLERKLSSESTWAILATLPSDDNGYNDSGLIPNTSYDYRISAVNGIGASGFSESSGVLTDQTPPTATRITNNQKSARKITIFWLASSYADTYVIERRLAGENAWVEVKTVSSQNLSWTDTDVSPETAYEYRIQARNSAFASAFSEAYTVTTPELLPPSPPVGLYATTISSGEIQVNWSDISDETGYRIERTTDGTPQWQAIAELPADTEQFNDTDVEPFFEYFYRIVAINEVGESSPSLVANATAYEIIVLLGDDFDNGSDPATWARITGGSAVDGGAGFRGSPALWFGHSGTRVAETSPADLTRGGEISFKMRDGASFPTSSYWDRSETGESVILEYSLNGVNWYSMSSVYPYSPDAFGWSPSSFQVPIEAATASTRFRFRQLKNSGKNFDTWAIDDFKVTGAQPEAPDRPGFLLSSVSSASSIVLLWAPSAGATSYQVERFEVGTGWKILGAVSGVDNYFTDTGLKAKTNYSYRIHAKNAGGSSPYSFVSSARTYSQWQGWHLEHYQTLEENEDTIRTASAQGGSSNLFKFAFNLSPTDPDLVFGSTSEPKGQPKATFDQETDCLVVSMLRRKSSSNPGVSYQILFSNNLVDWLDACTVLSTTSIDPTWETVLIRCDLPGKTAQFAKVIVTPSE